MRIRTIAVGAAWSIGLLLFAGVTQAAWWTKVLEAGESAGKLAGKASGAGSRTAVQVLKTRPIGLEAARALKVANGEVRAVDAADRAVVIAAAAAGGALALTPDGARLLRQVEIIVEEADVGRLQEVIRAAIKASGKTASLVRQDGTLGRIIVRSTTAGETLLVEKYPGIFLAVGGKDAGEIAWALEQSFRNDKVRVVSLMDASDVDDLARIEHAVGELHIDAGSRAARDVVHLIRSQRRKTVFLVGHVEDDRFVVRNAAGELRSEIRFAELEAAAKRADASLFMLGCSAGACSVASGFIDPVNALHVADGLRDAISQPTLGHALSALSSNAGDVVVHPQLVAPVRVALDTELDARVWDQRIARSYRVVRMTTVGRERAGELSDRIIPFVPSWIQIPYLIGAFALLFFGRSLLREWKGSRIPAPSFRLRPLACVAVKGVRAIGFIALMPFAVALNLAILGGVWCLGTVLPAFLLGWPALVPAYFGWQWARTHRQQTEGEHWSARFLPMPIFVAGVTFIVASIISPIEQFRDIEYADGTVRLVYWLVTGGIALIVSALAFRLLAKRPLPRASSDILGWVVAAPIFLIEWIACRIVRSVGDEAAGG